MFLEHKIIFVSAYIFLLIGTIVQRFLELRLSRRNEILLKEQGAYEVGQGHFFYMKLIHTLFFISLLTEWKLYHFQFSWEIITPDVRTYFVILFIGLFFLGQILRWLTQRELKTRWTAKVLIWPKHPTVKTGIYKLGKHPNYFAVCLEMFSLPLIMGLWKTAFIFSILNSIILYFRIKIENEAIKLMNLT